MKKVLFLLSFILTYSCNIYSQEWDTTFLAKLTPGGKQNTVKIHSTFFPETPKRNFTELKYIVGIDGNEKKGRIVSTEEIKISVKTIDIDKTDDYEHLLIYYKTNDPIKPELPFYGEYLYVYNDVPELAKVFYGNETITYGNGFINYNCNFGFGNINRKCTIEKNKFKEILEKEYPLEEKKGIVTESFILYSSPDTNSSVVENTFEGEKVDIISCNLNEFNPDNDEEGYSVIWFKIKTEKGKVGWANRAHSRIEGKGIIWAG